MKMRTNALKKRSSLNLSINAIVVLILAITMLGLGLGFIRNVFGSTTENFEQVSQQIKDMAITEINNLLFQFIAFSPKKRGDRYSDIFPQL